jgi:hypothetical protein
MKVVFTLLIIQFFKLMLPRTKEMVGLTNFFGRDAMLTNDLEPLHEFTVISPAPFGEVSIQ